MGQTMQKMSLVNAILASLSLMLIFFYKAGHLYTKFHKLTFDCYVLFLGKIENTHCYILAYLQNLLNIA